MKREGERRISGRIARREREIVIDMVVVVIVESEGGGTVIRVIYTIRLINAPPKAPLN